ncbi:uncharacterized protein LOC135704950 [Ochlerotatus camptorhynchus]|uniref:uncharacterized protein LOC135704950 n=1 Tax=Ochlerotatus camptorhynchus TaxID=644619 RepID=UPI0031E31802
MPRVYKRKTSRKSWTEAQLATARHAIDCGMSVYGASAKYQIPRSTLIRRIASPDVPKKMGPQSTVFTLEQEKELVRHLHDLESRFYGINMTDVQKLAYVLAEKNGIPHSFNRKKQLAGRDWLHGFLKRNPTLSFRKPEATSTARARGFNKPSVNAFFDMLEATLTDKGFPPSRIYNADETGISTVPPKKQKIAAKKGKKQVGSITSADRGDTTSVVMCMSAAGHHLPPYVIFARARMHESLKKGAPSGTKFSCNPSGYMTADIFLDWFEHFLENVHPTVSNPVLLIIDGHSSHTKNLAFAERARANFVTVLVLPPHCSNKMQPLDISFMGPFKIHYASAAEAFMRKYPGRNIGQYDVAELMGTAFVKTATTSVAINGFKKSGIWPADRTVFHDEAFAPSEVTDQPEATDSTDVQHCGTPMQNSAIVVLNDSAEEQPYTVGTSSGNPENRNNALSQVSETPPKSSFEVSPSQIRPLPKMAVPRASKRKRKSEKAVEITSGHYRQGLATAEALKEIKSIKKGQKQSSTKRQKVDSHPEDVLCELCGFCFSGSVEGQGWNKCLKCLKWFHAQCYSKVDTICPSCT